MFCIACGTRLPDEAAFCSECGRATYQGEGERTAPASQPSPGTPGEARSQPTSARRWSEAAGVPFLFEGRWWSRGPSGEVVVWDAARSDWELALSAQTPFFMRRPVFTSLRTPATWLYVLLGFCILFSVLAVAADLEVTHLANRLENGEGVSANRLEDADAALDGMKGLQGLTMMALAPLFIWWTHRATKNLPALGARSLEFTPGWAIGWWLIPIANWFQPARVLGQAWKASDPGLPADQSDDWRSRATDPALILWWVAWLVANFAWNYIFFQWDSRDLDASGRLTWSVALAVADAGMAAAAMLAIVFVRRLTARQAAANARFDVPAPSAAPSPTGAAAAPSW